MRNIKFWDLVWLILEVIEYANQCLPGTSDTWLHPTPWQSDLLHAIHLRDSHTLAKGNSDPMKLFRLLAVVNLDIFIHVSAETECGQCGFPCGQICENCGGVALWGKQPSWSTPAREYWIQGTLRMRPLTRQSQMKGALVWGHIKIFCNETCLADSFICLNFLEKIHKF